LDAGEDHAVLARLLAVANAGEHITQGSVNGMSLPYQLDFGETRIRPLLPVPRSMIARQPEFAINGRANGR
jgi:hypothetical protein